MHHLFLPCIPTWSTNRVYPLLQTVTHGSPLEMRLAAEVVVEDLQAAGFSATIVEETAPRHYIVVATKD